MSQTKYSYIKAFYNNNVKKKTPKQNQCTT